MLKVFRKKGRVLLLDDDAAIQRLVSLLLKQAGLRVDVVGKGNEAIEAIGKQSYDAILLDLMMPHEGGMTVIGHLRETAPQLLDKVIVLTATPTSVLKTIDGEVAEIVHKPFSPEALVASVKRVIGG